MSKTNNITLLPKLSGLETDSLSLVPSLFLSPDPPPPPPPPRTGHSHEIGSEVVYDGAEAESVAPAGRHVGDPDARVALGDAPAPQLQRLHAAPLAHLGSREKKLKVKRNRSACMKTDTRYRRHD